MPARALRKDRPPELGAAGERLGRHPVAELGGADLEFAGRRCLRVDRDRQRRGSERRPGLRVRMAPGAGSAGIVLPGENRRRRGRHPATTADGGGAGGSAHARRTAAGSCATPENRRPAASGAYRRTRRSGRPRRRSARARRDRRPSARAAPVAIAAQPTAQPTGAGAAGSATPIIESRVTSEASSSSVIPSLPSGRRGITR